MAVNADKPHLWKADVAASVDLYNEWFLGFAPKTYRDTRVTTTQQVESAFVATKDMRDISPATLQAHPAVLPILRMATAPPIARDRLIGLAGVNGNLVRSMELDSRVPSRTEEPQLKMELEKIGQVIAKLADEDILTWLAGGGSPSKAERQRAASIVADRLCGASADPIVRNAQERRQLKAIGKWLTDRGYKETKTAGIKPNGMSPGTYAFRLNVPVDLPGGVKKVNIPMDVAIMPKTRKAGLLPIFIEAKSAGDFTNTNKRRKEEAVKAAQLRSTYGKDVTFFLFLCGYFDTGYLGYEAAEGIDWIWEHRIDDMEALSL